MNPASKPINSIEIIENADKIHQEFLQNTEISPEIIIENMVENIAEKIDEENEGKTEEIEKIGNDSERFFLILIDFYCIFLIKTQNRSLL